LAVNAKVVDRVEKNIRDTVEKLIADAKRGELGKEMEEVEISVLRVIHKVGLDAQELAVLSRGTGDVGPKLRSVEGILRRQGLRTIDYLSIFGPLEISRIYYWEKDCKGACPLDAQLNLPADGQSRLLSQWLYSDTADMPYDKAIASLKNKFDLPINKLTVEQGLASQAAAFNAFRADARPPPEKVGEFLAVTADCKGVRMVPKERPEVDANKEPDQKRDGLRKMAVVDCIFGFDGHVRTPERMTQNTLDGLFRTKGVSDNDCDDRVDEKEGDIKWSIAPQFSASMDGKEAAFERLAQAVKRRDPRGTLKLVVLLDGEKALRGRLDEAFARHGLGNRIEAEILDIIHVLEYLCKIAAAWFGFSAKRIKEKRRWLETHILHLFQGKVDAVIKSLERSLKSRYADGSRHLIAKTITYFASHKDMMRYDLYLAKGFPIATGIIEGACGSLVKDRMDIAGARWTSKGAQAMLNMRAIKRNGDWQAFWRFQAKAEHKRLYGHFSFNSI
jgi:hypothetical protein